MKNHLSTSPEKLLQQKEAVPSVFNRIASRYDLATSFSQGYTQDLETSVQRMCLSGNERVLDLCCGTGKSTAACLTFLPAGKVIGVDRSEGMLEIAKEKFASELSSGKVQFLCQDAMHLDFPDNTFDAIFMAYGLRNMPDYEACLRGLYRVLKPGGTLCVHEYSVDKKWLPRLYWTVLGYGVVLPISALLTGDSTLFRYLIRSVLNFLSPSEVVEVFRKVGFLDPRAFPLKSWRAPILYTFLARKPESRVQPAEPTQSSGGCQ